MEAQFNCPFEDYSTDSAKVKSYVCDNGITEKFKEKIKQYKSQRLKILMTDMYRNIFCDGTVYTGSAGIALMYYILGTRHSEPDLETLETSVNFLFVDKLSKRRISFVCGDAGPLTVAAVVSSKLESTKERKLPDYKTLCTRLLQLEALLNRSPNEILYGKAGYLYALLFVKKHINEEAIPDEKVKNVIQHILEDGKKFSMETRSKIPLLWEWHDKIYLGGAHGVSGILYLLLQARQYISEEDMNSLIKPTLDYTLNLQLPSGNFPSSMERLTVDRLVQWCHGAPGFTPLCLLAHQIFKEENYLKMALCCGEAVWNRICMKGYSLCHGVSGNAYSFIQLYQATKDLKHLYRACCYMDYCITECPGSERHKPDRPASLFEGLAGRILFADDMLHVDQAAFPGYTL